MVSDLTEAQQKALDYVHRRAGEKRARDRERIQKVITTSELTCNLTELVAAIDQRSRLTVNFHPDRVLADGRCVIAALFDQGRYRSQFETRISNGGLTAFPGGDRDTWEEAMSGGAYQAQRVAEAERPKYGGLNLMNYSDGACPRFGSCHFRLKKSVLTRATLVFGDSAAGSQDIGVISAFEPLLAGLLEAIAEQKNALGRRGINVAGFVRALLRLDSADESLFRNVQGHALDDYIEAQIHGSLDLADDVEALVVDPSFRNSVTGEIAEATAQKYGFLFEWHQGFELPLELVPNDFRGPEMPPLARRVAGKYAVKAGYINAATIGQAAVSVVTHPEEWLDWGTSSDMLQHIKYLWHILVVYGKPEKETS